MNIQKTAALFAIALLALVALVGSAQALLPDLGVSRIIINPGDTRGEEIVRVYVNESNNISAVVFNNGSANAGAFDVCFDADGVKIGCVAVAGLAAGDNTTLGLFAFDDIPAAPKRTPLIDVSFDIDADGILNVNAEDLDTGKKRAIRIEGSTKLADEEIGQMMSEAKRYEEADKKRRERIETINQAKAIIDAAEVAIKEMDEDEKVTEGEKEEMKESIARLKKGITGDIVIPAIKEDIKAFMNAVSG